MSRLWARVVHLLRTEGFRGFVAGLRRHFSMLRRRVFSVDRFTIYEFDTRDCGAPSLKPDIGGLEVEVLECEEDAVRLTVRGFEMPPFHPALDRRWLQRGGVAHCAFIDRRLAHVGWLALSAGARGCCDGLRYRVDFEHGEACWGGAYTWPRFRGLGLYEYVCGLRLAYMRQHGFSRCRDAVKAGNTASLRGQSWWLPRPCLSARQVRFLGKTWWREQPCGSARA